MATEKIEALDWAQTCCGGAGRYAESETVDGGFVQVWWHVDPEGFSVRRFDANKCAIDAERGEATEVELDALLA